MGRIKYFFRWFSSLSLFFLYLFSFSFFLTPLSHEHFVILFFLLFDLNNNHVIKIIIVELRGDDFVAEIFFSVENSLSTIKDLNFGSYTHKDNFITHKSMCLCIDVYILTQD